ncbi:MAG: 2-oxoacid:acceptor oxidoreductase subunit alpha [Planctomycetota bacterium]|nr:2-oxoacid:acceptor oxidoreductase subunit alpha [Planctomycetota bacterium]
MSEPSTASEPSPSTQAEPIVNRLSIQVATVNGSGSQTANQTLLRSIFRMGIPVSGKNLFPSNIAGLPTWFTIRANADGYTARRREIDVLVCMNAETAKDDVASVPAGATVIYEEALRLDGQRTDVDFYPVPFAKMIRDICPSVALRRLVINMIYVGVVAELLGIPFEKIDEALTKQFAKKPKAKGVNLDAVNAGIEWAQENVKTKPRFRLEPMDKTAGKVLVDGNTAGALGSLMGGAQFLSWYPITPSSSLAEALIAFAEQYRKDPETGHQRMADIQAEDELAAIGMVIGAGWAGARALTATSGPGISLMSEFIGLGYYAEIPGVIWNIQRTGPSTGLPTRTMQGDIMSTAYVSHGDTRHPCLYPADIKEAYEFGMEALDLAERLQTIVFVLSDLDLGMNLWMADPFEYPERDFDRGKVLDEKALAEVEDWGRYKDVDGDGIPYRTLPGTPGGKGAYFTRGSGHDEYARYTESDEVYARNVVRLRKKLDTAAKLVPGPVVDQTDSKVGILAYGTSHDAIREARDQLRGEHNLETSYMRVRGFPFAPEIRDWILDHDVVYVVEQNRDGQMKAMLSVEFPDVTSKIESITYFGGLPLDARTVTDAVASAETARAEGN